MDRVETRELEYFVAVAEELHFGRAAERLGIAQPPLSRAIGRLERRMGVQLFERTSRRVGLTAAGAVFLAGSRKALTALDTAVSRARRSGHPHRLTVAALQGTGSGLLARVLRSYRRRPGAADVEVVFTRDQVDFVRNGSADIALTCGHEGLEGLEFTELAQERTVALLPLDHFLAAKSAISSADLASEGLFRPEWPEVTLDEIIDQVAMGELIVLVGASATDRIGPAVVAVPVTDVPSTQLVLTWGPDIPAATRDAFVRTAKSVTAKHVSASEIPDSMRSGALPAD
ncbi:LysR family transcriptional regulator [Streptomyces sp. NPDC005374]|uniref:LysR family transcriptional regulator n=1 Tax=Streptomyces sp. NPDC005374 TaxID=3364713 RepID=UPI00367650B2